MHGKTFRGIGKRLTISLRWGTFNFQEVDTAFKGVTFQPVGTLENSNAHPPSHHVQQQPCLLL
ncbi:MAG: hypothetical protein LBE99_04065 [Puniceicoccales bacterium]|jgi:hypothetical protein|nr:hypothetical protein [Puniceicoccales bacterium]